MAMVPLPPEIVRYMRDQCPGRTDEALQSRFGISYNSWRRIEQGAAVRASLAERLIHRISSEIERDRRHGKRTPAFG